MPFNSANFKPCVNPNTFKVVAKTSASIAVLLRTLTENNFESIDFPDLGSNVWEIRLPSMYLKFLYIPEVANEKFPNLLESRIKIGSETL